ncbi:MAG: LysR family transcriptional regulator [Rhodobacteraceae bacterium]|nr:LysR family transcriptional regulator [Paracoccaceae bacterium]
MENWDDLKFVVALARFGSMAQAARHLRTNTATVSRRIKRINESSGFATFVKGPKDWELTPDGQKLFGIAARFSDELTEFDYSHQDGTSRKRIIRISTLDFLINDVFSLHFAEHLRNHQNIGLELSSNDNIVSLAFGEADIAVRLVRPDEGRLVVKSLGNIEMGIFGVRDCSESQWIGLPFSLDETQEMVNGHNHFGCPPQIRLAGFRAIHNVCVETGLPGVGPKFLMERSGKLQQIETECEMLPRQAWLVYHETRRNDLALREVASWIEDAFDKYVAV